MAAAALALALPAAHQAPAAWIPPPSPVLDAVPQAIRGVVHAAASVAHSALAFAAAHPLPTLAGVVLGVPLLAALEAGYIVLKYRNEHGSAPCPISPSHGTVTVQAVDVAQINGTKHALPTAAAAAMSSTNAKSKSPLSLPPLRLLVIGDSLAAGVGTAESCTPVLPESIATALSRDLNGRAVEWSVWGEPGASAGWITRTLEGLRGGAAAADDDGDDNDDDGNGKGNDSKVVKDGGNRRTIEGWIRKQLVEDGEEEFEEYKQNAGFQEGQYDVAVLLTGSNDLKFAVLPWMFRDQRREERTVQEGGSGGEDSFAAELRRAIEAVSAQMKTGFAGDSILGRVRDRVVHSVEEGLEAVRSGLEEALPEGALERMVWSQSINANTNGTGTHDGLVLRGGAISNGSWTENDRTHPVSADDGTEPASSQTVSAPIVRRQAAPEGSTSAHHRPHRPLVVLPALPADVLPASKIRPLNWIAFPLLRVIENAKRKLSQLYPGSIVVVDAPTLSDFQDFEQGRGPIWRRKQMEVGKGARVRSTTDVNPFECQQTLHRMREYSEEDGRTAPEPFLATDTVHPNDMGYEYWGRMIAANIVEEWAASGCDACATGATGSGGSTADKRAGQNRIKR